MPAALMSPAQKYMAPAHGIACLQPQQQQHLTHHWHTLQLQLLLLQWLRLPALQSRQANTHQALNRWT